MKTLNLPEYDFKYRSNGQSTEIFDSIRRKFVKLTPEEWVRQHFIRFITEVLQYPSGLITVETGLKLNDRAKRTDIVVHSRTGEPWMIIECKAPDVKLTQETLYQVSSYNLKLNSNYIAITNGINHYCCQLSESQFRFIDSFPAYDN